MDDAGHSGSGEREADAEGGAPRPALRVVQGGGRPKPLHYESRNDLARVLVGTAGDLLLRRISAPRAHEVERKVERLMELFDRLEDEPLLDRQLRKQLDELEALVRENREKRPPRGR